MHELGVAQSILDIVRQYVPESRAPAVRAVTVRVGQMSGVLAESLEFCFGAITAGTAYAGAYLEIERIVARAQCRRCQESFALNGAAFVCPRCGGPDIEMVAGQELQVAEVILAESEVVAS